MDPSVGPHFEYAGAPNLFGGRAGEGPLDIVWDTNVLLDYVQYGPALWERESLGIVDDNRESEIESLGVLISLWIVREIRLILLPEMLVDARRPLSASRATDMSRAFDKLTEALSLSEFSKVDTDTRYGGSGSVPDEVMARIPAGGDRSLVRASLDRDAHVFLTSDKGVLRCRQVMEPYGLLLVSPADLIEELAASGALHCVLNPQYLQWPMPDLQRTSLLIEALAGVRASTWPT